MSGSRTPSTSGVNRNGSFSEYFHINYQKPINRYIPRTWSMRHHQLDWLSRAELRQAIRRFPYSEFLCPFSWRSKQFQGIEMPCFLLSHRRSIPGRKKYQISSLHRSPCLSGCICWPKLTVRLSLTSATSSKALFRKELCEQVVAILSVILQIQTIIMLNPRYEALKLFEAIRFVPWAFKSHKFKKKKKGHVTRWLE